NQEDRFRVTEIDASAPLPRCRGAPSHGASSTGTADFTADVANDGQSISWQLTYSGLESHVLQSHIHFGQRSVNGGISVFLCTNVGTGPAGTPPRPAWGTTGGFTPPGAPPPPIAATVGARTQGINTGEWNELLQAIDAGKTYANIHTMNEP